jgi:chemotaxis protein MotB
MALKRKHPVYPSHDRWLVSYADFITLLFAFFVVLFAASNTDQRKAGQLAKAVKGAFQDLAVFSESGKVIPLYDDGGLPSTSNRIVGNTESMFDSTHVVSAMDNISRNVAEMNGVRAQLEKRLTSSIDDGSVRLSQDLRGLTISLAETGFFDPGSAVIRPKALEVVNEIAATILKFSYNVRVEGHTDDIPIHTVQFPSNWELSTARATNLLQYLISHAKIPPERLSAVGYGEYHPAAPNTTAEGRAANRRVDLVILSSTAQKLEPDH